MKQNYVATVGAILGAALVWLVAEQAVARPVQQTFSTPEEAVTALTEAVNELSKPKLTRLFGDYFLKRIDSGDPVADRYHLEQLRERLKEGTQIASAENSMRIVEVGRSRWPFPAPLVMKDGTWAFNPYLGAEEVLNRRIGENELRAIRVARFFVAAQKLYYSKDRDGDGVQEYAARFVSSPGKQDGLYWAASTSRETSPFGPLFGKRAEQGYGVGKQNSSEDSLYQGYYYRILKRQGQGATGGSRSYARSDGSLTDGVALLAYPSRYGVSGIMSFLIGQDGILFERDLGEATTKVAKEISDYDPGTTWSRVEQE